MRTDHVMILSRDILILNGGYSDNHYFNDTWYYKIEENRWLEKTSFVHAFHPTNCTDDIAYIDQDDECIELQQPHPLRRAEEETYEVDYGQILPYREQHGYTPDPQQPLYFGIVHDADELISSLRSTYLSNEMYDSEGSRIWIQSDIPDGTPIAPFAATGPRQYAKKRSMDYNGSLTLEIWEWCISVEGEPTRGKIVDGKNGRANSTIHIPQPRRKTVGWDGCRELRWVRPPSRSGHKGVLVEKHNMIVVYGGISYLDLNQRSGRHPDTSFLNVTHDTIIVDDMWIYAIDNCPRNCSDVGICTNGFCKCDPGYYGLDCSNITCPGSVCYNDEDHEQHCEHCCYDGFTHSDGQDDYIAGIQKKPCRPLEDGSFTGHSNGICDGFGSCQCAPPFLGEDCSIKDCRDNCNGHGFCSLEFPVARCICNKGYKGEIFRHGAFIHDCCYYFFGMIIFITRDFSTCNVLLGDACQHMECLNNCSFPNGECDHMTGLCTCAPLYSPSNASQVWNYWQGDDCSFLTPWCGAWRCSISPIFAIVTLTVGVFVSVVFV